MVKISLRLLIHLVIICRLIKSYLNSRSWLRHIQQVELGNLNLIFLIIEVLWISLTNFVVLSMFRFYCQIDSLLRRFFLLEVLLFDGG